MLELDYRTYLDKVHGGWIGKCIGGAIGASQENNKSLMCYRIDNVFPAVVPPNDDLDLQVLYLQEVLEKLGSRFASTDIANAFAQYNLCLANEYSIAIRNVQLGIEPPLSGSFNNSYFNHSMGCPIRSEIWAFICPGHPEEAARYAALDGIVDHEAESVYGEQFYAVLESNAFFEADLRKLIALGLGVVPAASRLAECLAYVQELHGKYADWREARTALIVRFGSADASYSIVNVGITLLALLYGNGDFTDTLLMAVNCGYDTDCTAATAGAILGILAGANGIPQEWLDKIGEDVVVGTVDITRHSDKIVDLAKDTCAAGLSLARDGVTAIRFINVPAEASPSLPLPRDLPAIDIAVDYDGLPSIGYGEPATVRFTLTNNGSADLDGALRLTPPNHLRATPASAELFIEAGGSVTVPVTFATVAGIAELPQRNLIGAAFRADGADVACERTFGLSGASRMKLIGPFWDNYDTTKHDADPFKDRMPAGLMAMFNGFVDIDRPYIDESFVGLDEVPGHYVNMHEDVIRAQSLLSYRGPCCLYLVHDFYSPEDRHGVEMLVGNEGAFKLWLNGVTIGRSNESAMWMPYNHSIKVGLKAGHNRMVIKLIRRNRASDFSYLLRSEQSGMRLFVDLATGIAD